MTADEMRAFRETHSLSQEQFAGLVGVSISTIQKWERGARAPNRFTRPLLERAVRRIEGNAVAVAVA